MPLYVCSQCSAVDNTALTEFFARVDLDGEAPRCSECITGTWHGKFEKRLFDDFWVHDKRGFVYTRDEARSSLFRHVQICDCGDVQAHYKRAGQVKLPLAEKTP